MTVAACHNMHHCHPRCSATAISTSYRSFLYFICLTDLLWHWGMCGCVSVWHQIHLYCCVCVCHAARWSVLCVVLSQSWCRGCVLSIQVTLIILFLLLFTSVIILSSPPSQRRSLPAPHLISSLCQPFVGNKIHTNGALQNNYPKYDAGIFGLELSPNLFEFELLSNSSKSTTTELSETHLVLLGHTFDYLCEVLSSSSQIRN